MTSRGIVQLHRVKLSFCDWGGKNIVNSKVAAKESESFLKVMNFTVLSIRIRIFSSKFI